MFLKNYKKYPDIKTYTLENIEQVFETRSWQEAQKIYMKNTCTSYVPYNFNLFGPYPDLLKPIIATKIPGISEQITDQKQGILIPLENPQAITGAVCRLIEDRPFAEKLGKAARQKVQTCFSVEKMVKETENVYLSLLHTPLLDSDVIY